jgi:hypothetical protein
VGRFLGNRLKSCLRTTAKSGDYLLWNVLPLWEMAIPFPFPVKKPGNNRVRVAFRSNSPDEDSAHTSLALRLRSPQKEKRSSYTAVVCAERIPIGSPSSQPNHNQKPL